MTHLLILDSGYFFAGCEVNADGVVVRAAPIVKWTVGKTSQDVQTYANKKGWGCEIEVTKECPNRARCRAGTFECACAAMGQ